MKSIHEKLEALGVSRTIARVVEVLADGNPRTMHEIERAADLRQSEVSNAVTTLSGFFTISYRDTKLGRGRPQKIVQMKPDNYRKYISEWADYKKREYENVMKAVDELEKGVVP